MIGRFLHTALGSTNRVLLEIHLPVRTGTFFIPLVKLLLVAALKLWFVAACRDCRSFKKALDRNLLFFILFASVITPKAKRAIQVMINPIASKTSNFFLLWLRTGNLGNIMILLNSNKKEKVREKEAHQLELSETEKSFRFSILKFS